MNRAGVAAAARVTAVYRPAELRLAPGDTVRVTANGKDVTGRHRLNNGAVYTVDGFTRAGDVRLGNGWVVGKDFGHLAHGYVVTSHAAQGRTVDRVLVAAGPESFPASGKEQFYVSVSRGRRQATVYTPDKGALREAVQRQDVRMLASELVRVPPKGVHDRLTRRVAFLRDLGARARDTVKDYFRRREPEVSRG
jgi:ATP-dependent exoDNAse (exonuclease V) alpha subunit